VGDVDFYLQHVQAHRSQHTTSSGTIRLLYVGQLIPRKGIRELLTVLSTLGRDDWDLRIIGSGPLRESLEDQASQLSLAHRVTFVNYLDRRGLVKEYAEADIFVLPSLLEVGAIVNSEALASGLYSLISLADGVAPDLIDPGINGERIDVVDTQACAAVIDRTLDRAQRGELKPERISQTANRFTPRRYARAFLDAVEYALKCQGAARNTRVSDGLQGLDC
jgi:glycosyltransferase involved in cell wall biosynthesis